MKLITSFSFIILSQICFGQFVRNYFFDDRLEINDSTTLVLIVHLPQTKFAQDLNHRIYTDTNFIRKIKESWFTLRDTTLHGYTSHRCDFDLYFYNSTDSGLIYLNHLNSQCDQDKLGSKSFEILLESGKPLHVDTLTRIGVNSYRANLFNEHLITSFVEGNNEHWGVCRTKKYPRIYYESYFTVQLELDSNFTVIENVEQFLLKHTQNLDGINWNIARSNFKGKDKIKRSIDVTIYLKSAHFKAFEGFKLVPISFNIERGSSLILMYDD